MKVNFSSIVGKLTQIDILKSIFVQILHGKSIAESKKTLFVILTKGSVCELHKTAQIISNNLGRFRFNCHYGRKLLFKSFLMMRENSRLILNGTFSVLYNSQIFINEGATLELGAGYINNYGNISCFDHITIGNGTFISEKVTLRDSDDHSILDGRHQKTKPIVIGDHVWIGLGAMVLKGVKIGNGSIVAAGSIVTKDIPEHCIAAGVPAKVIRENVEWQ